jgi:hypothetical protein
MSSLLIYANRSETLVSVVVNVVKMCFFAYQVEELLAAPSCTNKLLLRPMVEILSVQCRFRHNSCMNVP